MSDDSLSHGELDALTRRTEAVEDRVESLQVQTGGNFAAVIEGQAALRREVRDGFATVNHRLDALTNEVRTGNARIIELLSTIVGQNPQQ